MIRYFSVLTAFLMLVVVPPAWAVDFNHDAHLAMDDAPACSACHLEGAESIKPDTDACLGCHEQSFVDTIKFPGLKTHGPTWSLNHRTAAKSKNIDCEACHQQEFCLECHKAGSADEMGSFSNNMINVHTSDFHVTHPIAARTNPRLCNSCHEPQFCKECHDSFAPADLALSSHRQGWSLGTFGGAHASFDASQCQYCHVDSVLPAHEWSNRHAREARKNLATCQACHPEGDVCMTCHSAVSGLRINPHPDDWGSIKNRISRASNGVTCRKCHN